MENTSSDAVLQTWIEQQIRWARSWTDQAVDAFMNASRNRAMYWVQVQQPKPPTPMVIEAKFTYDKGYPQVAFIASNIPASSFDPDSILPKMAPADDGAIEAGGPVGKAIPDNVDHPVKGKYNRTSTDKFEGGHLWTSSTGRKFIKIRTGFAGMEQYWIELK